MATVRGVAEVSGGKTKPSRIGSNPGSCRITLRIILVLLTAFVAFQGCATTRPAGDTHRPGPAVDDGIAEILVSGGVVVRRDRPDERLDLLLERRRNLLVLTAAAEDGQLEAVDTLDVRGLYIHTADHFDATADTGALSVATYIVREGAGAGTPARWLVGPYDIRAIEPAENHPSGPVDERVGCYTLERGDWDDPEFEWDPSGLPLWFPDTVRLHWQYQWPHGPGRYLVATDGSGQIRDPRIAYYAWEPVGPDSIRVAFGVWYLWTTFRGAATDGGFAGEVSVVADGGLSVRAPAELHGVKCRSSNTGRAERFGFRRWVGRHGPRSDLLAD